jgi:hypothetical protein
MNVPSNSRNIRILAWFNKRSLVGILAGSLLVAAPAERAAASNTSRACGSATSTIVGTEGPDRIQGTPGRDVIVALGGDDDVSGLGGDDVICGGAGDDILRAGEGVDRLFGQDGDDLLAGGSGGGSGVGGGEHDLCTRLERHTSCRTVNEGQMRAVGPTTTARTSAMIRGFAPAGAMAMVFGGAAPATGTADADGVFVAEALLRPGRQNLLTVYVQTEAATRRSADPDARGLISDKVRVQQTDATGPEEVTGRVVDPEGQPVADARVSYGDRAVQSGADGGYTLTGLPAGRVALKASRNGYLAGLSVIESSGTGADGVTEPLDIMLQPLAAPVTIGTAGGTFEGNGYKVHVPSGAVGAPTPLNITPLMLSGDKDGFGFPIVDLSPSGRTFRKPIVVEIDPAVIGLAVEDAQITGLDPETGSAVPLPSQTVNGRLRVSLRELNGIELRLPFKPDALGTQCDPYNPAVAVVVRKTLRDVLPPFLLARMGLDSALMYRAYLQGGRPSATRRTLTGLGQNAFRDDPMTVDARDRVVRDLGSALIGTAGVPALQPPATPATRQVKDFGVGQTLAINYAAVYTVPGNLAGGIGHSSPVLGRVKDSRAIDGPVRFVPSATARGVLTGVSAEADLKLTVLDSVDFCPGDAGASAERYATIPLSRLEMTDIPILGGTFATPLLFIADPDLDGETYDVSDRYPTNDRDGDGVPDRQPWQDGGFTLDNCPDDANPGQADRDGDGAGDACDDTDEPPVPDPGPPAPGPAGSFGDPHLVTYDSLSYDFQAAGDYVVAEDATKGFEIQYRFARRLSGSAAVSYNRGVAARVGGSVIAFGDTAETAFGTDMPATLDGVDLDVTTAPRNLPGAATVRLDGADRVVRWADGTELRVGPRSVYSSSFVTVSPARRGQIRGLFGNADGDGGNDLTARDGTVVTNSREPEQLYGSFGASWRAQGTASLFRTPLPNLIGLPVNPSSITSISELSADARAFAERTCRARGLQPGAGLEQCILDVGITGDADFADLAAEQATRLRSSIDASALTAEVETTSALTIGQRATGSLDSPIAVDVFTVDLAAGDSIRVEPGGTCSPGGTFSVTLVSPTGRAITRTRGSGCGSFGVSALRESGRFQLRVQDAGGFTGDYGFDVSGAGLGLTCRANEVGPNDDGSSDEITLPFSVDFGDRAFSSLWVNNNGNVTFDGPLGAFTPSPLATYSRAMAAAWWSDVDTSGANGGQVRYGLGAVDGRRAFCVDYDEVGFFGGGADPKRNSFQLYVVDRADVAEGAFDLVYRYSKLQWETGRASGGSAGLGGVSATVGYTNGSGVSGSFLEVPGSRVPGTFLDGAPGSLVTSSTGTTEPGVHVFAVRPA